MMEEKHHYEQYTNSNNTVLNSFKSSTMKTSSSEDDYLSEVTNPFDSSSMMLDSLTSLNSNNINHKMDNKMVTKRQSDTDIGTVDKLNATFDRIDLSKIAGRGAGDGRHSNEDMMSLSGQDMPDVESMKPELFEDEEQFQSGELFQDPSAYDFLLNVGNSNKNTRDFAKESLFVKFDPLFGKPSLPTGRRSDVQQLNNAQEALTVEENRGENTPAKINPPNQNDKESSNMSAQSNNKESVKTPKGNSNSAIQVLDRILSLTPVTTEPVKEQPKADPEKMQYIEELKQLRQIITKQEQEFQELQHQLGEEKARVEQLSNKEQALVKRIAEKTKMEQQMGVVMSEYEKNIAQLIADRELEKQKLEEQVQQLTSERDVAMQHLSSVESAFSDVHQKYERSKVVIEQFKSNEGTLKADNASLRELVKQQDTRYDTLKAHAISQLDKANADLEALKRKQEMEVVKCTALLKKAELKTISLQEALTQKQKENEELMAICDGLIQKVGQ